MEVLSRQVTQLTPYDPCWAAFVQRAALFAVLADAGDWYEFLAICPKHLFQPDISGRSGKQVSSARPLPGPDQAGSHQLLEDSLQIPQ